MIGVVTVKVSAGNPRAPLCTVPVFVGSDCTLAVTDVPDRFFGVAVTSVAVAVMNASGSETSVSCTRSGPAWCCTVPAAFFDRPGEVRRGVVVSALGVREDGQTEARWILGVGQLDVMEMGCVPAPGVAWQDVHLRDEVPPDPVKGDLAKHGETWKIYTGEAWESLVAAKELASKSAVDAVSAMAAYPMSYVVGGALKDRTINYSVAGGTFTFPARTGTNARDFVLVIGALSDAPTVTFPGTPPFQYVSDQPADEVWTADAGKVNAWYFSEISDGVLMVSHKVMDYVAQ